MDNKLGKNECSSETISHLRTEIETLKELLEVQEHSVIEQSLRLEKSLSELRRSNTELQQFAYIASHDLQEPLRMVTSYLQLLKRRCKGKLDTDAEEFIGFAVDGAARMQNLIQGLLTYSRVSTHGEAFKPIDCTRVFEQALGNLQIAIEESKAVVTYDTPPVVMGDEMQLVQLFQNLMGNAIKFNNNGPPRVHVSAEEKGGDWVFSVRDNGIGIAPEYKERIFRVFQRLHNKTEYPGTGIGLAACRKIVERHGGRIWVESGPENGSTFYFTVSKRAGSENMNDENPVENKNEAGHEICS